MKKTLKLGVVAALLASGATAALALTGGIAGVAAAQDYPYRDITTAVVWGAGGGTDVTTRMMMIRGRRALGQDMVVVNKRGGAGVVVADNTTGAVAVEQHPDNDIGHADGVAQRLGLGGQADRVELDISRAHVRPP